MERIASQKCFRQLSGAKMTIANKIKATVRPLQNDTNNNDHLNNAVSLVMHDLLVLIDSQPFKTAYNFDLRYWSLLYNIIKLGRDKYYITYNEILSCSDFLSSSSIDRWLKNQVAENYLEVSKDPKDQRVKRYNLGNSAAIKRIVSNQVEFLKIYLAHAENLSAISLYAKQLISEYQTILKALENTSQGDVR
jgi:hypothetical protein